MNKISKLIRTLFRNRKNKYRISVMDTNFKEKYSFFTTKTIIYNTVTIIITCSVLITATIIFFTPIRNLVPGYINPELVKLAFHNQNTLDTINRELHSNTMLIRLMQSAINGNIIIDEANNIKDTIIKYKNIDYEHNINDSILRMEIENSDKYAISSTLVNSRDSKKLLFSDNLIFFPPIQGEPIDDKDGTIIECIKDDLVKTTLSGLIIFSDWSPKLGYFVIIQHENNIVSVYGYNSSLLKKKGDYVNAGDVIAIAGNHPDDNNLNCLYFELWYNGSSIKPDDYISF